MQKSIFLVSMQDDRMRKKALMTVSGFKGFKSMEIDDKNEKLTVIGNIDPPAIAMKLRKICNSCTIDTVEPVKKPETKPEPEKKPDPPKPEVVPVPVIPLGHPYGYYPSNANSYYASYANARIVEEEPKICVIS